MRPGHHEGDFMNELRSSVALAGSTLGKHRHVCAFFRTRDEEYRVLLPFMVEGIDRGEKAFHIVDPALRTDHLSRLQGEGVDVRAAEMSGQLEVCTWDETYLQGGRFDQHVMLALVEQVLQDARTQGFPLTRLVAHMEWALADRPGVGDLVEYEARASALLARYEDPVLCTYDGTKFGADLARDVLRTHPMALSADALQANPGFVPPDQLLHEIATRGPAAKERLKTFTVRCIHCTHVILAGVGRIGEDEADVLREHLRACRRTVPIERRRGDGLGRLLKHYQVAEE
jgi:hypothetical protein